MKKGFTVWLTGYSGSGKTTISQHLYKNFIDRSIACEVLDGDIVRQSLSYGLGFTKEDRCIHIRRIGFVAELLSRNGIAVIVSAISPYREGRDSVRKKIGNFVEVYVKCSLEECTRRDTKGLYKKAITGEITQFTGISDPYEEPLTPEITCNTEIETIEMSVNTVLAGLKRLCFINY
jgi:adenylylsulfate kinase